MEEFVTVDDRAKTQKVKDWLEDKKRKAKVIVEMYWENRDTTIPATVGVLAIAAKLGKQHNRNKELEEAETRRERAFYDRSLGVYWETRRPLTTAEMLEVEDRKKHGESIGAILDDMGLLKRKRR